MHSAKLITPKKINELHRKFSGSILPAFAVLCLVFVFIPSAFCQDNSPYSRYGIGDLSPTTNIINRGMGSISAGYADFFSINFSNPAAYSSFQSIRELKSKKQVLGRAILDVGLNIDSRTLREPSIPEKFVAKNALFSYVQVGVSLRNNWGLSFGLRPVSRISYNIFRSERLNDPVTGVPIDSAITRFEGSGGLYLPTLGTGFSIIDRTTKNGKEKLSVGVNVGYLFGSKDYSVRRSLINDSVLYYQANFQTKTALGNLYLNGGLQYRFPLNKKISMTIGGFGAMNQNLNASKDALRETFVADPTQGTARLDSVFDQRNVKGKVYYPATYTVGFVIEKEISIKEGGWLFGVDFSSQNWDKYRFYGQVDSLRNKWEIRLGTQWHPIPKKNYFSNVAYRAGFFMGPDYINVGRKLSQFGITFGMGLPVTNFRTSYASANQSTFINLAFEYGKRGNDANLLKESLFRFSVGLSLSDFWFSKRKYE